MERERLRELWVEVVRQGRDASASKVLKWIRSHNRNAGFGSIAALLALTSVWECDIRVNMCAALLRKCEFAVQVGVVFIYIYIFLLLFISRLVWERKCDRDCECGSLRSVWPVDKCWCVCVSACVHDGGWFVCCIFRNGLNRFNHGSVRHINNSTYFDLLFICICYLCYT